MVLLVLDEHNALFELGEDEAHESIRARVRDAQERFASGDLTRELSFDAPGGKSGSFMVVSSSLDRSPLGGGIVYSA